MDKGQYSIVRIADEKQIMRMNHQSHKVTVGLVEIVFGSVPKTLEEASEPVGYEWALNLHGGNWLMVKRTA